ncbi:unnamed protein product [Mucor circinelloides]
MESFVSFAIENFDMFLTVSFMLYPFLAVIWESYTVGARIELQRANEHETIEQLATQVGQAAKNIDQLRSQTVAKNLLERHELEAIAKSNAALSREIDYLSDTVEEEQTAIKELAKLMHDKNRLVDALVMVLRDLQQGLRLTNGDQAMLAQQFNNMFAEVNAAQRDIQLISDSLHTAKTNMNSNSATLTQQIKDVYIKVINNQKSNDAFKEWVEGEIRTLIANPEDGKKELKALKKEIASFKKLYDTNTNVRIIHLEDSVNSLTKELECNQSCQCDSAVVPKIIQMGSILDEQQSTLKEQLRDFEEFKDDYYRNENVNHDMVQKLVDTLHKSYVSREEFGIVFRDIHREIAESICTCRSATLHPTKEEAQRQEASQYQFEESYQLEEPHQLDKSHQLDESHQLEESQQGESQYQSEESQRHSQDSQQLEESQHQQEQGQQGSGSSEESEGESIAVDR